MTSVLFSVGQGYIDMGKMELKTVLIFFKDAVQSDKKEPKQALNKNIFFSKAFYHLMTEIYSPLRPHAR